jgi:hypothetical protein
MVAIQMKALVIMWAQPFSQSRSTSFCLPLVNHQTVADRNLLRQEHAILLHCLQERHRYLPPLFDPLLTHQQKLSVINSTKIQLT